MCTLSNITCDVAIVTHNRREYLSEAIGSVISQSFTNYNCYVISDYEPEWEDLANYLLKLDDERFQLIRNSKPGANASRNKGLEASNSCLVAFLDDDDTWHEDKLHKHVMLHSTQPDLSFSYSSVLRFHEAGEIMRLYCEATLRDGGAAFQALGPATTSAVVVNREKALSVGGFDDTLPAIQDWDLFYRLCLDVGRSSQPCACIKKALVNYRYHRNTRISGSVKRRHRAVHLIMNKYPGDPDVVSIARGWIKQTVATSQWDAGFERNLWRRLTSVSLVTMDNWRTLLIHPDLLFRAFYYILIGSSFKGRASNE